MNLWCPLEAKKAKKQILPQSLLQEPNFQYLDSRTSDVQSYNIVKLYFLSNYVYNNLS